MLAGTKVFRSCDTRQRKDCQGDPFLHAFCRSSPFLIFDNDGNSWPGVLRLLHLTVCREQIIKSLPALKRSFLNELKLFHVAFFKWTFVLQSCGDNCVFCCCWNADTSVASHAAFTHAWINRFCRSMVLLDCGGNKIVRQRLVWTVLRSILVAQFFWKSTAMSAVSYWPWSLVWRKLWKKYIHEFLVKALIRPGILQWNTLDLNCLNAGSKDSIEDLIRTRRIVEVYLKLLH